MNASAGGGDSDSQSLNGFYAYKNTFDRDVHWVDIPKDLRFFCTTDPFDENAGTIGEDNEAASEEHRGITGQAAENEREWSEERRSGQTTGLNTNGLEALSAAALSASPQTSMPPHSYAGRSTDQRFEAPNMLAASGVPEQSDHGGYGDKVTSTLDPSIDPSLTVGHQDGRPSSGKGQTIDALRPPSSGVSEQTQANNDVERKIGSLLRGLNQSPSQWPGQVDNKGDGG